MASGWHGRIPIYLGQDPLGAGKFDPVGVAVVDDNGDVTVTLKADKLKEEIPKLSEMGQIRGLALTLAYMAPEAKKENE